MKVIWVTGLPGSGKTTFSRRLHAFLTSERVNSIVLDGDELRAAFNHKFGFTREERIEVAHIYINLAKVLANQGLVVIVSTVSLFNEIFTYLEIEIATAKTVFINANKNLLDVRNQKQLRSSEAQNSPGVSLEVDYPRNPTVTLRGDENEQELISIFKYLFRIVE